MKATGTAAGIGALASLSTPALAGENYNNSDKDAITSAPNSAGNVLASVNQYPSYDGNDWYGTLIEDVVANRYDIEHVKDVHVMLWDGDLGETLDVRNDAAGSELSVESGTQPELHLHNWFQFSSGYYADLYQDVIVSADKPVIHIDTEVQYDVGNDHTIFTLVNPHIDDFDSAGDGDEAYTKRANGYEFIVATDGTWHLAYAQHRPETGQTTFDGHRIGVEGTSSGSDKSAWHDIYGENDGYIDSNDYNSGDIDTGVGLYVGTDTSVSWETVIGFGTSESDAIDNATAALDNGYASERQSFLDAWSNWHSNYDSTPTGDATADTMYQQSLTALRAAKDSNGPTVAGLFEPHGDQYTYVWPRDQVIMIQSLLSAGATGEARDALQWLDDAQIKTSTTGPDGYEREGTWWQNYYVDGSKNWESLQLDQVGGPVYAHWLAWQETGSSTVLDDHYRMSKRAADRMLSFDNGYGFPKEHQDPWEEEWGYTTEGTAAAIAGLRCMAEMADANGESSFATDCRNKADTWASNFDDYCYKSTSYGDVYVTCDSPSYDTSRDEVPDAAALMSYWPWNVRAASSTQMQSTLDATSSTDWTATNTPCLDRYPGDDYTPSDTDEDGGWPLCEAYADVARWQSGRDGNAVSDYVFEHAEGWRTAGGFLPERVDGDGNVRWNSILNWSQAMFVLLTQNHVRGSPYGLAPRQ
jgi:GH15 family glucan-1,4-alpha-glucosidase